MKWYKHDFDIARGNRTILIAKYDNSDYWFDYWAFTWTGAQLEIFREIGKLFNSKTVEVKPLYDNDGKLNESEENVITIITFTDSTGKRAYKFRQGLDVKEGCSRQFKYFELDALLKKGN